MRWTRLRPAQLSLAGAGGSNRSAIANLNGKGTNTAFCGPAGTQRFYSFTNNTSQFPATDLWLLSPPSDYKGGIEWQGAYPDNWGRLWFWPTHSSWGGELLLDVNLGNIALNAKFLQHGVEYNPLAEFYQHFDVAHADNTNLWYSVPLQFCAWVWTNQTHRVLAGSLDPSDGGYRPTLLFDPVSTNGSGAWRFFGRGLVDPYQAWRFNNEVFRVTVGPDQGVAMNGGITVNGQTGITTNYALGVGDVINIQNGVVVGIIPSVVQPETLNFLERIGWTTNSSDRTVVAVNRLVQQAKFHGWWTNCEAIYPMVGSNVTAYAQNLKTNQFNLTWAGSPAWSSTGMVFNGSSQYGDTGYVPATEILTKANLSGAGTNSFHLFAYVESCLTNSTEQELLGVVTGSYYTALRYQWSGGHLYAWCWGLNGIQGSFAPPIIDSEQRGTVMVDRMGGDTSSEWIFFNANSVNGAGPFAANGLPASSLYLGAFNANGAANYFHGTLAGATVGAAVPLSVVPDFRSDWDAFQAALGRKVP